jgi:hypothetical protein
VQTPHVQCTPTESRGLSGFRFQLPKLRVHNFAISVDGHAAGPNQRLDDPLGVGGPGLHEWAFATRARRQMHGMEGGDVARPLLQDAEMGAARMPRRPRRQSHACRCESPFRPRP